jgi:hypothetical protein
LCGGQCVGADNGRTEQRKSVAQGICRYVAAQVVHHDQTVHDRNQFRSNGIGIRVRRDLDLIARPAGQFADVVQAIYNFPVLISSTLFRIEFQFSD